jgi:carbon monoxide dehydrogenase subunit G
MAKIKVEENFAAKAAAVWEKLADFGGIDRWMPGVKSCESTGHGVGAERTFSVGPAKITERLEKIDPVARTLTYSIVRGPMPVKNCFGTISVSETGAESCRVEWSATFDLPEGVTEEQVAPALKGGYRGALKALKTQIES